MLCLTTFTEVSIGTPSFVTWLTAGSAPGLSEGRILHPQDFLTRGGAALAHISKEMHWFRLETAYIGSAKL